VSHRIVVAFAISVALAAPAAAGSCPAVSPETRSCQQAVAKGGARYAKSALSAIHRCLQRIQNGSLAGDPATLCRGGVGVPPTDARTATLLGRAGARMQRIIRGDCNDAEVAQLDLCAPTVAGLPCLADQLKVRLGESLDAQYGSVPQVNGRVRACQMRVAKETTKYLDARLKAVASCLDSHVAACGTAAPFLRCLRPSPTGPSAEQTSLALIGAAESRMRAKIARVCTNQEVQALDACADDVTGLGDCLVCAHGNSGDRLLGVEYETIRLADPTTTFQAAANAADAGDTLLLEPGTYNEAVTLKDSGLHVLGMKTCATGARAVVLPPNPGVTPNGIFHCGSRDPDCDDVSDGVLFQGFEVSNFTDNDILTTSVDGVTYRDMVTHGPGVLGQTRYGIFPILSKNVLIENCLATGISDAALYVGQSVDIVVRNNEVHSSVAGIEIENSANAEVYGNYSHDNAGGLLVFKLPGLPVQLSNCHNIHDNVVVNNNGPNFGEGIVGLVPPGTGMLVLSNDAGIFRDNTITGNGTFGLSVVDQVILDLLFDPFTSFSPNQDVNNNAFIDNNITGNGGAPLPGFESFAFDVVFLPSVHSGNCQNGNAFGTVFGGMGGTFPTLPACPPSPMPAGCPYVEPPTTTTTTVTTTTSPSSTTTTTAVPFTFAQVQAIFTSPCADCHGGIGTPQYAGLKDLDIPASAYANTVNAPSSERPGMDRIEPFDSANSYLMHKLDGTQGSVGGFGSRMPPSPYLPLTAAELEGIRAWINTGAPN
jgi:parallel beta-helix repeat protein